MHLRNCKIILGTVSDEGVFIKIEKLPWLNHTDIKMLGTFANWSCQ